MLIVLCVCVAVAVCCRGPLGWLVPSEIQPLETRAAGTGINTGALVMILHRAQSAHK